MRRQEKQKKSKLFLPFFIIGILVLSVFGVMIGGLTQGEDAVKYNDFILELMVEAICLRLVACSIGP